MIKTVNGEVIEDRSRSTATIVIMLSEDKLILKQFGGIALAVPLKEVLSLCNGNE